MRMAIAFHKREVRLPVGVIQENPRATIAAVGDVVRYLGNNYARKTSHGTFKSRRNAVFSTFFEGSDRLFGPVNSGSHSRQHYYIVAAFLLNFAVIAIALGCAKFAQYPLPENGASSHALLQRAYLDLMYDFNGTPSESRAAIYAIKPDFKPKSRLRIGTINQAQTLFTLKIFDQTSTHAIVQATSNKPDQFNWSFFGGAVRRQEWILKGGQWLCNGFVRSEIPEMIVNDVESKELAQ
jgi:hypothetical protein